MKIIVNRRGIKTTVDTSKAKYPYQYRDAFKRALELDGLDESTILEIFNQYNDVKCTEAVSEEKLRIGENFSTFRHNFKTNKPLIKIERIYFKDKELYTEDYGNSWVLVTDDPKEYLPEEYLEETWTVR